MNKNKIKELQEEVAEINGTNPSQEEVLSGIGKSILSLVEKNHTEKTKNERKDFDKKLSQIKGELTDSLSLISNSLSEFKKSVEESTALEEGFESVEEEIDSLQEEIDSLQEEIDSLQEEIDELRASIETAFTDSGKRQDEYGVSLMSLSERLDSISKTILLFDESIKSLHKRHGVHLERFDIVDKHFLQLEKDLKKYSSQIYEYGSSFSILNNGALIGTSNALNFKAGSNITITLTADTKGAITAQFDASGGGGFSTLAATETPNGSTTVFTFASATAKPHFVMSDHVWMPSTDADGVTVNWTWNNGTKKATMTIPPYNDIIAIV